MRRELGSILWSGMLVLSAVCIRYSTNGYVLAAGLAMAIVSLAFFGYYMWQLTKDEPVEPPKKQEPPKMEWVDKYFAGEFDPQEDTEEEEHISNRVKKLVIREVK